MSDAGGRGPARVRDRIGGSSRDNTTEGAYGSTIGGNPLLPALAELVGTFVLVFTGTAVATAAILERPTAGPFYDSLAVALAFGLAARGGRGGHRARLSPGRT